jgi:hypothetical protein
MFSAGLTSVSECISCGVGTYNTEEGATSLSNCVQCDKNTYSNVTGASVSTTCKPCDITLGYVNNKDYSGCANPKNKINTWLIVGAVVAVVFAVVLFFVCRKKIKSIQTDHGMELAETHDNTRRLLDSANNPLEQTQYLIDPSELHLGERVWLLVVVCDCSFVSVLTFLITCLIDRQQNWCGWHGLDF